MDEIALDHQEDPYGRPAAREFFYVTARDGDQTFPLAGPYETKAEAEAKVDEARGIAMDFDRNTQAGRAAFMAYGVTKLTARLPRRSSLGRL